MKQLKLDYLSDLQNCLDGSFNIADKYGGELPMPVVKSLAVLNKFLMEEIDAVGDSIRKELQRK